MERFSAKYYSSRVKKIKGISNIRRNYNNVVKYVIKLMHRLPGNFCELKHEFSNQDTSIRLKLQHPMKTLVILKQISKYQI